MPDGATEKRGAGDVTGHMKKLCKKFANHVEQRVEPWWNAGDEYESFAGSNNRPAFNQRQPVR
jgi:hypothetical protein